ncbi:hypothetical protein AB0D49_35565 [Streptomyces sp. NPDC048290]|uniref:hypothetical protein n=1 Tax=Streptomyces sp. NPDC048290 TaxID=3155811 RepID=UPI0034468F16
MYELSRVLLQSVGPQSARYENVLLDLSGVGASIVTRQAALFSLEDEEPVRRPSPATVLFLENGGGKSVLIKLIFSVLLPGRRQVVGASNPRTLDGFVLDGDVSHIALEWTHARSGRRLVTGKAAEWRNLKASSEPSNLMERWYHFRPTREISLESLPLSEDGRYLRLRDFFGELDAAQQADPDLEFRDFRIQSEWTERLVELGLDPELFRYQRSMNAGEGEAADVFTFATDAAFVEFLLSAVVPVGPAQDLAELLHSYGHKLGRRGVLALERDFVTGALEVLEPLAATHAAARAAHEAQRTARRELEALVRQIKARAAQEAAAAETGETVARSLREGLRKAAAQHDGLVATARELARLTSRLRLSDAKDEQQQARTAWQRARTTEKAWDVVPVLARSLEARAAAHRLRELVRRTEEEARPAMLARDAALKAFVVALRTAARDLTERSAVAEQQAEDARLRAEQAQSDHDIAVGRAADRHAEAKALDGRIDEVMAAVGKAVQEGLLAEGMTAAEGARWAEEAVREKAEAVAEQEAAADAAAELHDSAHRTCQQAERTSAKAEHALDLARREWNTADELTRALEAEIQPLGLFDLARLDLEADAPALARKLAQRRDAAETAAVEVRIAMARDERARLALETNELLPPSPEAADVCAALRDADIDAFTGWDYVAGLPRVEQRRRLLAQVPHLVTGVLLNEPEQALRAQEVLAARNLWPSTLVALGTTVAMHEPAEPTGPSLPGVEFVVPPHPALYDERAAGQERLALGRRHDEHRSRLSDLDAQQRTYLTLLTRLESWQQEYPAGRLGELRETLADREQVHAAAQEALAERTEDRDRIAAQLKAARDGLPVLRDQQRSCEARWNTLRGLAEWEALLPDWRTTAAQARVAEERERDAASQARADAEQHRAKRAEHVRTADRLLAALHRMTAELDALPGADTITESEVTGAQQPLPVLRQAYESAVAEYARAAVGAELLVDLEQAEAQERAAVDDLGERSDPETRSAAQELLSGPDGVDAESRAAARRRAADAVTDCQTALSATDARVAERQAALREFPEPVTPVDLEPYGPPQHVTHGLRLVEQAEHDRDEAARVRREITRQSEEADSHAATVRGSATHFADLITVLSRSGEPREDDLPFDGGVPAARERHGVLKRRLDEIGAAAEAAFTKERSLADLLVGYAAEDRFGPLASPSRSIIQTCPRAELPAQAASWSDTLRPRLRSLTVDLDSIERHRRQIVLQLSQQVQDALRTLRRAQNLSRLPKGLKDWSEQEFLRIRFNEVPEQALQDRLGTVVDDTAEAVAGGKEVKRDGMALLLRGVTEAVAPKGFRVRILKPDAVLRTERVPVSDLKDVFSGGQVLTAAIILYCTMAALRANEKGKVRHHRHSGVLFLDNPIGRASASYLLRLQQSVARALGVQLVYTTGLNDLSVLDSFPLVIRLRNDADLRAHRKYLTVVGDLRKHLLEPLEEGDSPVITSIGYHARGGAERDNDGDVRGEHGERSEEAEEAEEAEEVGGPEQSVEAGGPERSEGSEGPGELGEPEGHEESKASEEVADDRSEPSRT